MSHFNPIGWGVLDRPESTAPCGAKLGHCAWTGNPNSVTCKKCRKAMQHD